MWGGTQILPILRGRDPDSSANPRRGHLDVGCKNQKASTPPSNVFWTVPNVSQTQTCMEAPGELVMGFIAMAYNRWET